MSSEPVAPAAGDAAVTGDEGQKKRRLETAEPSPGGDQVAAGETTEADYKNRLKRLLKLAPPDVVLDILATM